LINYERIEALLIVVVVVAAFVMMVVSSVIVKGLEISVNHYKRLTILQEISITTLI